MKYTLAVLLIVYNSIGAVAQKHNVYADVGTLPGFSITYDHKFAKHWGVGLGVQANNIPATIAGPWRFIPAVFGEIRLHIRPEKNNQFFSFLDVGIDIYDEDNTFRRDNNGIYDIPHDNGFYSGLGFGYFRRMTKRGQGPYASLKILMNWYETNDYSLVSTEQDRKLLSVDMTGALSIGFKF